MATTLYQPLKDWQTRILELQPGRFGEPLDGDLHVVDLVYDDGVMICDQQRRTQFFAVSYCWGDAPPTKTIRLQRTRQRITTNLYRGLQRIRSRRRVLYLWIDSICICQSDVAERSKQVSMMLDIYSKARHVIAWLGEKDLYGPIVSSEYRRLPARIAKDIRAGDPLLLAARPWASRIWVQQEIWAAKSIILKWHDRSRYWEDVFEGFEHEIGFYRPTANERLQKTLGDSPRNILAHQSSSLDLFSVLNRCVGCECSDPRDHVYGVLGMSAVATYVEVPMYSNSLALVVDYRRDVAQVFQDVAEYIIKRDGDLSLLYLHATFGGFIEGSSAEIPSWVPDWRRRTRPSSAIIANEQGRAFYAFDAQNADSRMEWLYSDVQGGLRVRTWHLGTVSSVSSHDFIIAKIKHIGLMAWSSYRRWQRRIEGCISVTIGTKTTLWQHRDADRDDLCRVVNGLLSITTFREFTSALRRGESRWIFSNEYLPIVLTHDESAKVHEIWIPRTRIVHEPQSAQDSWRHANFVFENRMEMAQATTERCQGPARLRERSLISRDGTDWKHIVSNLVHRDRFLKSFFNHPADLWFVKRWVVPRGTRPGDQIMAVRGGMHPIVVRPQADRTRVEYIGRADFGVSREHRSLGEALERCSQQMVVYGQRRRDRSRIERRKRSRSRQPFANEQYISTRERERLAGCLHRATQESRVLRFYYDLVSAAMRLDAEEGNVFEEIIIV